jgi:sulfur-oxidizing protein SoxY
MTLVSKIAGCPVLDHPRFLCRVGSAIRKVAIVCSVAVIQLGPAGTADAEDVWSELKGDLFGDRSIQDGADWLRIEAPYRAEDAALVPIDIIALHPQDDGHFIKTITLVIDQNPAPVAAVFHFGPNSGSASLSTRVRVNAYTDVRAIAETGDGDLYMASRFVKAAGGCSAPALKDPDAAMANLGKMKLRQFDSKPEGETAEDTAGIREAQLMIRHPNYSGLQMDQITRYYIPARFVHDIEIRQGDDVIMSVDGAISLSEDPTIRFHFQPNGSGQLTATVKDTEGAEFTETWSIADRPPSDS